MEMCPCGSQKSYTECCEPFITGKLDAPTAEQLMRSRYSAYAKQAIDYILNTTLEEKRKECDERAIRNWSSKSIWHSLEILSTKNGLVEHNEGLVEFVANFTENGIIKNWPTGRAKRILPKTPSLNSRVVFICGIRLAHEAKASPMLK